MGFLSEIIPETLPEVQAVKGFFDSLTLQKVIPPLILLAVGLVAVRLMLRLFERALERSKLERAAYEAGEGKIPVQLFGDFLKNQKSVTLGEVEPQNKGQWQFGDVRGIFPERLSRSLAEGISSCEYLIPGFSRPDAVLSGVESRTSSPVHIERDENLQSTVKGLYPCGEGAGYAGGIISAAMDGERCAERVAEYVQ